MFNRNKKNEQRSEEHYQRAIRFYQQGQIEDAIFALGVSIGADPQPEAYRLLGHLYTCKGAFSKAAGAHSDGRHLIQRELPLFPTRIPETVIVFYHDEALAYLRDKDWHFSRIRAQAALDHIKLDAASRYTTYGDTESWLRLIHAVASLQESYDFAAAHVDALWLQQNSVVAGYRPIFMPILSEASADEHLAASVLKQWVQYDLPQRTGTIVIEGEGRPNDSTLLEQ